jgi:hypothetical protein
MKGYGILARANPELRPGCGIGICALQADVKVGGFPMSAPGSRTEKYDFLGMKILYRFD